MESVQIIERIQTDHQSKLVLTGLAALQYPTVLTHQITFFNPGGGKKDYYLGKYHILIRRLPGKKLETNDHLLFIARHIDLYAGEIDLLMPMLQDISLKDIEKHDRAWRIFAYLRNRLFEEPIPYKKNIGRRYIDLGDINSPIAVKNTKLHIRDALLVPKRPKKVPWSPIILHLPNRRDVLLDLKRSKDYFRSKKVMPLFHRFSHYVSRLESAASAKIEGYDARVEAEALGERVQKRMQSNRDLRAHLNMDNLHRDLVNLCKEPLTRDLLLTVQKAIVKDTWRNEEEKFEKTPGILRPFDEVIVDRGRMGEDNIVYIAPRHQDVGLLLDELIDAYYHMRTSSHPLDLAALFKAQLTIIHPFGDGNGRLSRWCFLYILMRERFIDRVDRAPISHIFLEEKNRYYDELLKIDRPVMREAKCSIEPRTQRYRVHYDSPDIYRSLDYSSWLTYIYDAFSRALNFSIEEHRIFERVQTITSSFEKKLGRKLYPDQQHEVNRAIDIGLKEQWGKKTEKRLLNNKLETLEIQLLKGLIASKS